jgi:hypothetical protein
MVTRAAGTKEDNIKRSFVESPTRTNDTAQEVVIGGGGELPNRISTTDFNSRAAATLAAGGVFQGVGEDVSLYARVGVAVTSSNDSDGVLTMEVSHDGITWGGPTRYWSNTRFAAPHMWNIVEKYFRIKYTNGTTEVNDLSIQVQYSTNADILLGHQLNESLAPDVESLIVRSSNFGDEVVIGRRTGVSSFNKFGYREDLMASSGEQTVWETTGNFTPMTVASTFTIAYNSSTDGLGSTGATQLYFYYIDSDGLSQISPHVLGNTGSDVTSFSGLGINRIAVSATGSAQMNTNDITITETTGGTKQAIVPATESVTQQAIFFCDSNSDAVTKFLYIHVNKISGGGAPRVLVKGYVFNREFETRYMIFRTTIDTASDTTVSINEPVGFKLAPSDVLYFVADTDTNNTAVNLRFSLLEYKRN